MSHKNQSEITKINQNGLVLLGCGKMGSAMLAGWLANGVQANAVYVSDPHPSDWLKSLEGLNVNTPLPSAPAVVIVAVKPQMMQTALPSLTALGNGDTLFISIAAGTLIARFETILGAETPIIRAMPNTPAAINIGITAICGNKHSDETQLALAETLLQAIGQVVRLDGEHQMDAVTAVSGSGPAYVFHLIETLAAAAKAQGLPEELSMKLAKATVEGAGMLAASATESPATLRQNVTSPGGTTAAALDVLMNPANGFPPLISGAVEAAANRSKELSNE